MERHHGVRWKFSTDLQGGILTILGAKLQGDPYMGEVSRMKVEHLYESIKRLREQVTNLNAKIQGGTNAEWARADMSEEEFRERKERLVKASKWAPA